MWSPKEIRKTIMLIAGILFIVTGIFLIVNQVSASGSIDINSTFVSGKIQSGSAGLFLCFIGFLLCVFTMLPNGDHEIKFKDSRFPLLFILLATIFLLVIFKNFYPANYFLNILLGVLIAPTGILIFIMVRERES